MAFMESQVTRKMVWLQLDGSDGITFVPADDVADCSLLVGETTDDEDVCEQYSDYYDGHEIYTVGKIEGFGARLSAPGYMDCTEWSVYETAQEAEDALEEMYGDE